MARGVNRAAAALGEQLAETRNSHLGKLAKVTGSNGHIVTLDWPGAPEYASAVADVPVGTAGIVTPLRGGQAWFQPLGTEVISQAGADARYASISHNHAGVYMPANSPKIDRVAHGDGTAVDPATVLTFGGENIRLSQPSAGRAHVEVATAVTKIQGTYAGGDVVDNAPWLTFGPGLTVSEPSAGRAHVTAESVYAIIPTSPVPRLETTSLNVATAPISLPTRTGLPNGTYVVDVAAMVPITRSVPNGECWVVVAVNGKNGEATGIGYGGMTWSASSWFPLGARWHGNVTITDRVLEVGFRFAGKLTAGTTYVYKPIVSGIARRIS